MKSSNKSRKLLKELSRDPHLKQVIAKARHQPRGKVEARVESVTGMFVLLSRIASRFAKKKRARAIDDLADTVHLLFQVSLLLKENIFDRPEVKNFFRESSKQVYVFVQECVATILPATKVHRARPAPARTLQTRPRRG